MNLNEYQNYIVPFIIVGFLVWRFLRLKKVKSTLPGLIENGAIIVDVRSRSEFQQGSRPGSLNIPLDEIDSRSKKLDQQKTIVLCCASGARSGMASGILKKNGFQNVVNAGPWTNTV